MEDKDRKEEIKKEEKKENIVVNKIKNFFGKLFEEPYDTCYLTTACMKHLKENFDDNCEELRTLRWFRDYFVSKEDIEHYYEVAPLIVDAINKLDNSTEVYEYIYNMVVCPCVKAIKNEDYLFAYNRYKYTVYELEAKYLRESHDNEFVKTLKPYNKE